MGRLGFYFDQRYCSGCRTCQIACKDVNDLDVGTLFREVSSFECGTYPNALIVHSSLACNHCESPACVAKCPTGAMYVDEATGLVLHDDEECIACESCVKACPYGAPVLVESMRVVRKCDGCVKLRENGEEPACVASCVMRCLHFGDMDELKEKYGSDGLVNEMPYLPSAETAPSLLIKPKETPDQAYRLKAI